MEGNKNKNVTHNYSDGVCRLCAKDPFPAPNRIDSLAYRIQFVCHLSTASLHTNQLFNKDIQIKQENANMYHDMIYPTPSFGNYGSNPYGSTINSSAFSDSMQIKHEWPAALPIQSPQAMAMQSMLQSHHHQQQQQQQQHAYDVRHHLNPPHNNSHHHHQQQQHLTMMRSPATSVDHCMRYDTPMPKSTQNDNR